MTPDAAKIIENAKLARSFNICAGEADIPAPLLIRAAVAYARMVQQGWIAPINDDLDLPHAIVTIAANYADYPPSTIHRRKLFATPLGPDDEPEPEAAPVDPRQMSLIADPVAERVASIVAHHRAEADRFDKAAQEFEKHNQNADAADRCRVRASVTRTLGLQIERGDDLLEGTAAGAPTPEPRGWQRGDLVLVDGDKEGCVKSVNGNVAQVALWDRAPAVVNVSRLSPLEVTGERVEHPGERIAGKEIGMHAFKQVVKAITEAAIVPDTDGFYTLDAVIDPRPAIRCKPEVGVVLAGPDGPILTVDPLDGGNVWEVNIGDVVAWAKAHTAVLDAEDGSP